jgi:hypothetical protein
MIDSLPALTAASMAGQREASTSNSSHSAGIWDFAADSGTGKIPLPENQWQIVPIVRRLVYVILLSVLRIVVTTGVNN